MSKLRNLHIDENYHIYSRGVGKMKIFIDDYDYLFFINLIERYLNKDVKMFCFTLLPNHFHFLIENLKEYAISELFQKILSIYSIYFNKKYNRRGAVFESKFQSKHVDSDEYLNHLKNYIWYNPVKLMRTDYKSIDLFLGRIHLSHEEETYAKNYRYKRFPKDWLPNNENLSTELNIVFF